MPRSSALCRINDVDRGLAEQAHCRRRGGCDQPRSRIGPSFRDHVVHRFFPAIPAGYRASALPGATTPRLFDLRTGCHRSVQQRETTGIARMLADDGLLEVANFRSANTARTALVRPCANSHGNRMPATISTPNSRMRMPLPATSTVGAPRRAGVSIGDTWRRPMTAWVCWPRFTPANEPKSARSRTAHCLRRFCI